MNEDNLHQIQKRIRSPRSAALAGILFSGLMVASMLLLANTTTLSPADISREWLESRTNAVSLALSLIPFAGMIMQHLFCKSDQVIHCKCSSVPFK